MKLFHLSDLHLGIRLNEYSLLSDQRHILGEITEAAKREKPQAVILAGDIYDKPSPPAEAVALFDEFLRGITETGAAIFIISGNHDSAERISFGGGFMAGAGVYVSPLFSGEIKPITLFDEYGAVNFYLLPFIKPINARLAYPEESVESYTDAVSLAIKNMNVDKSARNILIAHQFVTGAASSGSEELNVGGLDNVDCTALECFDYVALGHIHRAQRVGKNGRYCGTPLKYSISEVGQEKSLTTINIGEKGTVEVSAAPLAPLRDMRIEKGCFCDVMKREKSDDYIKVILTDEEDIAGAVDSLRTVFPNMLMFVYDNVRTRAEREVEIGDVSDFSPTEVFGRLFETQNNKEMSAEQLELLEKIVKEAETDETA